MKSRFTTLIAESMMTMSMKASVARAMPLAVPYDPKCRTTGTRQPARNKRDAHGIAAIVVAPPAARPAGNKIMPLATSGFK